jgi:hypothetical protein
MFAVVKEEAAPLFDTMVFALSSSLRPSPVRGISSLSPNRMRRTMVLGYTINEAHGETFDPQEYVGGLSITRQET